MALSGARLIPLLPEAEAFPPLSSLPPPSLSLSLLFVRPTRRFRVSVSGEAPHVLLIS